MKFTQSKGLLPNNCPFRRMKFGLASAIALCIARQKGDGSAMGGGGGGGGGDGGENDEEGEEEEEEGERDSAVDHSIADEDFFSEGAYTYKFI